MAINLHHGPLLNAQGEVLALQQLLAERKGWAS